MWSRAHLRRVCVCLLARAGSWVLDAILQPGSSVSSGTLSFLDKVQAHTLIAYPIYILCVCVHIHVYVCARARVYTYMCMRVCVSTLHRRPGVHSLPHVYTYCVYIYTCTCVRACVYTTQTPRRSKLTPCVVCVYVYMCVRVYHTDAHALIAYLI